MTKPAFKTNMAILSAFTFLVMAYVDYATGYELVFSAAYLIPVSLCAWFFGKRSVILMSFAAGTATWIIDALSGHSYSHFLIQYWNSFTCLIVSLITGFLLIRLRKVLEQHRQANDRLQNALEKLEASTQEIRRLQDGLQVVCAWTKQIKVGEQWMTPDEFLSTQLHLKISHGMSPAASLQFEEELKTRSENQAS